MVSTPFVSNATVGTTFGSTKRGQKHSDPIIHQPKSSLDFGGSFFFGPFPKQVDGNENPFGFSKGEKKVECGRKKAKRFFIFPI